MGQIAALGICDQRPVLADDPSAVSQIPIEIAPGGGMIESGQAVGQPADHSPQVIQQLRRVRKDCPEGNAFDIGHQADGMRHAGLIANLGDKPSLAVRKKAGSRNGIGARSQMKHGRILQVEILGALVRIGDFEHPPLALGRGQKEILVTLAGQDRSCSGKSKLPAADLLSLGRFEPGSLGHCRHGLTSGSGSARSADRKAKPSRFRCTTTISSIVTMPRAGDHEPRLDGEDHPRLEQAERFLGVLFPGRAEQGRAVVGEAPDLVAERVGKLLVARLRDDGPAGGVDFECRAPPASSPAGRLRSSGGSFRIPGERRPAGYGLALPQNIKCPLHVRAVILDPDAEIHIQDVAPLDRPAGRIVMGLGRVGSGVNGRAGFPAPGRLQSPPERLRRT